MGGDGPPDALARGEQAEIDQGRNDRVKKQLLAFHHEVFPRTKPREPGGHEIIQPTQRPLAVDRQPEIIRRSRIRREFLFHQCHNLPRDPVRLDPRHLRLRTTRLRPITERLPVLLVKIPASVQRLAVRLHQKPELCPHAPVVRLHEERLLALGPRDELLPRHEKLPRRHQLERKLLRQLPGRLLLVIIVRLRQQNPLRLILLHMCRQRRLPSHLPPQPMLVHHPPPFPHLLGEVPLGRKQQHQPLLVIRQLPQPPLTLDNKKNILFLPRPRQRRIIRPELVAKDPDRATHRFGQPDRLSVPCRSGKRRADGTTPAAGPLHPRATLWFPPRGCSGWTP